MKKLLLALPLLLCTALSALAQNAITLPIAANAIADLGNGPVKVRMIAGNASIFTSLGSGVGSTSGSSTALTLTTTPATPPIVGGLISGSGIASGTTVAAFNGTTGITLSAAMTVPSSTTVSWGSACPSSPPSNVIQASAMADYYIMYTQARVCAVSPGGPVNTLLIEPIFYDSTTVPAAGAANDFPIYNSGGTGFADSGVQLIPNGTQLYASPSGSDTNNTCTNSGLPCTLKGACLMRSQLATFLQSATGSLQINLAANSTYSALDGNNVLCTLVGNSGGSADILTILNGPSSAILAVPAGRTGIFTKDLGELAINGGVTITGGNGSIGISGAQSSIVDADSVTWGSFGTTGIHYSMASGSFLNITGETLNANIYLHIAMSGAYLTLGPGAVNIPSALAWAGAFIQASGPNYLALNGSPFTGSGVAGTTGVQGILVGPGYMQNGGTKCASYFPGNNGCQVSLGFMDDAAENQTSPQPVGGVSCPSGIVAGTVTVVNGVVTHC